MVQELGGLHHKCAACGGSCQGAIVSLLGDAEIQRITVHGQALGIAEPVVDGRIRQEAGQCVFLSGESLCQIHAHYGPDQKPQLCRQFPIVAIRAEDGVRIGVDPACYHSWSGWETGPEVQAESGVVGRVQRSDSEVALEKHLVHFCESGAASIASVGHWLCGSRPGATESFPEGLAGRIWDHLLVLDLRAVMADSTYPVAIHESIEPLLLGLGEFQTIEVVGWLQSPESEWALETLRRFLYLRLYSGIPSVAAATLMALVGIVGCMGAGLQGPTFGKALASWVRLLRYPDFCKRLFPDAQSMKVLVQDS